MTFSIASVFDRYTNPDAPLMTASQAEAAVNIVQLADLLSGADLDQYGSELIKNGRARLVANPSDPVGQFLRDAALELASERQDRKYGGPSRTW
jgi:uncharacterized short protein YbdD (DUF466 family)